MHIASSAAVPCLALYPTYLASTNNAPAARPAAQLWLITASSSNINWFFSRRVDSSSLLERILQIESTSSMKRITCLLLLALVWRAELNNRFKFLYTNTLLCHVMLARS
jgi:hypothetical protein